MIANFGESLKSESEINQEADCKIDIKMYFLTDSLTNCVDHSWSILNFIVCRKKILMCFHINYSSSS